LSLVTAHAIELCWNVVDGFCGGSLPIVAGLAGFRRGVDMRGGNYRVLRLGIGYKYAPRDKKKPQGRTQ